MNPNYEAVIGLEVHIQLLTESKAYSADPVTYGELPNTQVSVISLGHPGTLPKANEKVIEYAVRLGIACGCKIRERNEYARKNYFYADLPKGYQITQDKTPICTGGTIQIRTDQGDKRIGITRIHMEEDAGKSIHDQDPFHTLIDLNRAGVPLLELVSEPDLRSGDEAYQYLQEVRKLVRYLDICDGNMEEGSLRCDANISVRKHGAEEFGVKVEVKNMNSIRNVQRAINHEIDRQIKLIESGGTVVTETRSFEATTGTTFSMRTKEAANDYRYFPEPDLQPVMVGQEYVDRVKEKMPPLPSELFLKYTGKFGLSEYDALILTENKGIALFYEEILKHTGNYKAAANWMMGEIKSYLNQQAVDIESFPLKAKTIADLISLVEEGKTSHTSASQKIFPELLKKPDQEPESLAKEMNLLQESDSGAIEPLVMEVLGKYPEKVNEYKAGKKGLLGLFMGEVMKASKGKADPKVATQLLKQKLDN